MATTKFYLDMRRKDGAAFPLRINICHERKTAAVTLPVKLTAEQWDDTVCRVENHPEAKFLNNLITKRKVEIDTMLLKMEDEDPRVMAMMSAVELRDHILLRLDPDGVKSPTAAAKKKKEEQRMSENSVKNFFVRYCEAKDLRENTKRMYGTTWRRIEAWIGEKKAARLDFKDITLAWIEDFDKFLAVDAPNLNGRRGHHANLKAVINYAMDHEVAEKNPYRRFKIKTQATAKRNMSVEALRTIIFAQDLEPWMEKYRDFFVLSFMLRGLNTVDLCHLDKPEKGRVEWLRTKTSQPLSLKIEPEMQQIIDRYAGRSQMLNFAEDRHYRNFNLKLSKGLHAICDHLNARRKGSCEVPDFTMYWARHTWATIAQRLGFSIDVIGEGLGHSQKSVTEIYIERDPAEVDRVNRAVLDWVLYGIDYRNPQATVLDGHLHPVTEPEPAKRRRGRPRKNPIATA